MRVATLNQSVARLRPIDFDHRSTTVASPMWSDDLSPVAGVHVGAAENLEQSVLGPDLLILPSRLYYLPLDFRDNSQKNDPQSVLRWSNF